MIPKLMNKVGINNGTKICFLLGPAWPLLVVSTMCKLVSLLVVDSTIGLVLFAFGLLDGLFHQITGFFMAALHLLA